ncbi:MAG TPA: hypothetical protein DCY07_07335 [Rhodospirillaceae bacterium]|nr:hypothetical protein [Rhodospirillaceae bacterium]
MIVKNLQRTTLIFAGLFLTSCTAMNNAMSVDPVATEPDLVGVRIAQAAEKASKALDTISGIEQYREPQMPPPQDYSAASPALTQTISVRWSGPIEQILTVLAERAGMQFKTYGSPSGVPVIVNLDVYQKPLIEVMHDLGLQAGRRADVSVNNSNNSVEIHYAPADRI